jgi:transcriptional regulator with XRE-family HTH domain
MKNERESLRTCGARIRYWRKERGYTNQGNFAKLLKIAQPSLSELENLESKEPSASTLVRAAIVLRLRPEYLLWGDGEPELSAVAAQSHDEAVGEIILLLNGMSSDFHKEVKEYVMFKRQRDTLEGHVTVTAGTETLGGINAGDPTAKKRTSDINRNGASAGKPAAAGTRRRN